MDPPVYHGTHRDPCVFQTSPVVGPGSPEFWKAIGGVWPELLLGFILAGFLEVLIPEGKMVEWLGGQNLAFGILAGWGIGVLVPGGPYLIFPIVANLLRQGQRPSPHRPHHCQGIAEPDPGVEL